MSLFCVLTMTSPMSVDESSAAKRCFSLIQSRKFWAPLEPTSCRLCPSMDLIVLGMPQSTPRAGQMTPLMLWLHRTVSWQKLATIEVGGVSDLEEEATLMTMTPTAAAATTTTHVSWSPDGRMLAVAAANVELYDVEALASSKGQNGDSIEIGRIMTWKPASKLPQTILGLVWAHMGRPHPSCRITEYEIEERVSMSYSSRYLFRATTFLPPSGYHLDDKHDEESMNKNVFKSNPSCQTPLSLLCIATTENGILLLLHGRYHIMTLDETPTGPTKMVCSSDLTHLLVSMEKSRTLSLFSFPSLAKYRFYLQIISALYCAISANIESIQQQSTEIAASWKSSLKPLDQKLEGLVRLLQNYGVTDHIKSVLLQFILVGHTTSSSTVSSAMDQFFSGVQMNDQLLQRMERSLSSALANVEKTARQGLLSPARLLVYHNGELSGLARFASDLLPVKGTQQLQECCEILLVCAELMVTQLVEARFRIRDFCEWVRATGSQVKARGTAANSVQRENAKKRRVPQAVVQRMIGYLQSETMDSGSITEHLLSLPISAIFHESPSFVQFQTVALLSSNPVSMESVHKYPTLPFVTNRLVEEVNQVFEHPRRWLSGTITRTELQLPAAFKDDDTSLLEIHYRQGIDCGTCLSETKGCFAPRIRDPGQSNSAYSCRSWAIVAITNTSSSDDFVAVQLFAIPLGLNVDRDEDDFDELEEEDSSCSKTDFFLTTQMVLPSNYTVQDLSFYGDDGKSSLSSGSDSGTGTEGRQALGLLVLRGVAEEEEPGDSVVTQELWIVRYDDLVYEAIHGMETHSDKLSLSSTISSDDCKAFIRPLPSNCDEIPEDSSVVFTKTRIIQEHDAASLSADKGARLLLSGSRGIGGVITTIQGITSLELFDLEDDEECDDEANEE